MEDAATAEISRAQIWQWLKYDVVLDTYQVVTPDYFNEVLDEISEEVSSTEEATGLLRSFCLSKTLDDFLTIKAYELL
jgi:malate synthase